MFLGSITMILCNPCRVDFGVSRSPGCAARPWALLWNRFAVRVKSSARKEPTTMRWQVSTVLAVFAFMGLVHTGLVSEASAQQKVEGGAKVLMLSGGQRNHHGYRRQAYLLQKLLEDTKLLQVTVSEDAAILETPALAKYDLIVAMADRRDPEFRFTAGQQKALIQFRPDATPGFDLHAFCCPHHPPPPDSR